MISNWPTKFNIIILICKAIRLQPFIVLSGKTSGNISSDIDLSVSWFINYFVERYMYYYCGCHEEFRKHLSYNFPFVSFNLRILHVDVHIVIGNESTADWQTMHNSYLASFYEVNMPKKLQMPGMSVVKETYKVLVWKSYQWTCICVRKLIIHICLCMKADHYNKIALCFCVG